VVKQWFDSLPRFIFTMNNEPNEPDLVAALETLKVTAATLHKIVFNEAALNYAKREFGSIRSRNPAFSPEQAVFAALDEFPDSDDGVAYCNALIGIFLACYNATVDKRLRWACGEGFLPVQCLTKTHSDITEMRLAVIAVNPRGFDLGNPRVATPASVTDRARALALLDVDQNLYRISAVFEKIGGSK